MPGEGPRTCELVVKRNLVAALFSTGHHSCYFVSFPDGQPIPATAVLVAIAPYTEGEPGDDEHSVLTFEHESFLPVPPGEKPPRLMPKMQSATPCPVCGGERPKAPDPRRSRLSLVSRKN